MNNATVIRSAEQPLIESGKSPLSSKKLLGSDAVSVSWVSLDGTHAPQNSGGGERFYYILTGDVEFNVLGQPAISATSGDVVHMPRNVEYTFTGCITYLYVNVSVQN